MQRRTALGKELDWEVLYGQELDTDTESVRKSANHVCSAFSKVSAVLGSSPFFFGWIQLSTFNGGFETFSTLPTFIPSASILNSKALSSVPRIESNALSTSLPQSDFVSRYFKRFEIPETKNFDIKLDPVCLSWRYEHSTLIVTYKKPDVILQEVAFVNYASI